jgi:6-phosphogluconolactonase
MSAHIVIGSGSPSGLSHLSFDSTSGAFGSPIPALALPGATFVVANVNHTHLYATIEGSNGVAAISANSDLTSFDFLNDEPAGGNGPCHLALDRTGRSLFVACYNSGTISAFPILPGGKIGPLSASFQHQGSGPDSARQESAHAHSVTVSVDNRFCYACDLGLDEVIIYRIGEAPGELLAPIVPPGRTPPGHGPRHAKTSPDGRFLYVLNELIGSVTTFAIDPTDGSLTPLETTTTLPPEHTGFNNSSEILIHPTNDHWLYAANRGPNSLAPFLRDPTTGSLTLQSIIPTGGDHPRNFALSPDGRWLVCANRHANELVTFAIDPANGALSPTAQRIQISDPCCVLFRS